MALKFGSAFKSGATGHVPRFKAFGIKNKKPRLTIAQPKKLKIRT